MLTILPIGLAQAVMGWRYNEYCLGFRQVPNCNNRTILNVKIYDGYTYHCFKVVYLISNYNYGTFQR
jgi:hypothetical protein